MNQGEPRIVVLLATIRAIICMVTVCSECKPAVWAKMLFYSFSGHFILNRYKQSDESEVAIR